MAHTTKKPTRKERKKARKSLAALLRRVRRGCKTMDQVSDWYDLAKDVEAVVNDNVRAIPTAQRRRLLAALKLPEATMGGVGNACGVLQSELGKTITAVGGATSLAGVAAAVVLLSAVIVSAVTVAATLSTVIVHFTNHGCGPFDEAQALFADSSLPAEFVLNLLPEAIVNGGNGVIPVPPLKLETDSKTDPEILFIGGLGLERIPLPVGKARDIRFNGQPLLGGQQIIDLSDLRGADAHTLVVSCSL